MTIAAKIGTDIVTFLCENRNMSRNQIDLTWIGDRLRELGKTQSELAEALGIDRSRVTEMLKRGSNRKPRKLQLHELPSLSAVLGLTYDEIVTRATGDPGYRNEQTNSGASQSGLSDPTARRTYHAAHDVLSVMTKHELLDMTPEEIHVSALVIAQAATKPGLHDKDQLAAHLQDTVVHLWDFKAIRGDRP